MQVFLRPGAIEAISFDLDDTLYDNRPIIAAAEGALLDWLGKEYPKSDNWQAADWRALKRQLLLQQAELTHDTSAARLMLLQTGWRCWDMISTRQSWRKSGSGLVP